MLSCLALACYAGLVAAVAPPVLVRARWPHRSPVCGVLAWQGLMVAFVLSGFLAVHHLVSPRAHVHPGRWGAVAGCLVDLGAGDAAAGWLEAGGLLLRAPLVMMLLPLGWFAAVAGRAHLVRRRHRRILDLLARPAGTRRVVVLDHEVSKVYCLPGRGARVVLTAGALEALSAEQLGAAVEHERAHIAGRHHLVLAVAEAFLRAFPGLPLSRSARRQTALLLEMAADDRAVRRHRRADLVGAMCTVAAGRPPSAALGAGGASVVARAHRLVTSDRPLGVPARAVVAAVTALVCLVPLLVCGVVD